MCYIVKVTCSELLSYKWRVIIEASVVLLVHGSLIRLIYTVIKAHSTGTCTVFSPGFCLGESQGPLCWEIGALEGQSYSKWSVTW